MIERRKAREFVLRAFFALEVSQNKPKQVFNNVVRREFSSDDGNLKFAENLYYRTLNKQNMLDEIITEHIENWNFNRLTTFDKVTLRMAISEFLFFDDIPTKVTMNEAIDIVKDYSTQKSGNFVNGILDSALKRLTKDGRINKKGRGLIESSINR